LCQDGRQPLVFIAQLGRIAGVTVSPSRAITGFRFDEMATGDLATSAFSAVPSGLGRTTAG
jgi:hypothetical protein